MSLLVVYSDRRSNWTPVDITGAVRLGSLSLTSSAELGAIASCEITLDDPDGDLGNSGDQILGMKKLDVYETDAPADNQHIFAGFIHDRTYEIGLSLVTGDAVRIRAELADANDLNRYVVIRGSDGNRSAETVSARLTWLLASSYCFVTDNGRVDYPTTAMDAVDYRNQTVANVLDDCAKAVGYNYFTYIDDTAVAPFSLAFFDSNTSTLYSSSLRISSVLSDVDSNINDGPGGTETWAPMFARLRRSDRTVASGVIVPYANDTVYQSDSGTADTYGRIEIIAADSNIKTAAAANARAARLLWEGSTEEDLITTAVMLPRANVNDVREGERLEARFRELPGYKSGFTWFRVLKRTVKQEELTDAFYTVEYDLSPQEEPRPASGIVQSVFNANTDADILLQMPDDVTSGNTLICIAGKMKTGNPAAPYAGASPPAGGDSIGGTAAWTQIGSFVSTTPVSGDQWTLGAWRKVANGTESLGITTYGGHGFVGIWEFAGDRTAGLDPESANATSSAIDAGTYGSPAADEIVLMAAAQYTPDVGTMTFNPLDFTPDFGNNVIYFGSPRPYWMGHYLGDGSAFNPRIDSTVSYPWAALAVLVPGP